MEKHSLELYFDNSGGLILKTETYCHYYDAYYSGIEQAVEDVYAIINDCDISLFEGNQPLYREEFEGSTRYDLIDTKIITDGIHRILGCMRESEKEFFYLLSKKLSKQNKKESLLDWMSYQEIERWAQSRQVCDVVAETILGKSISFEAADKIWREGYLFDYIVEECFENTESDTIYWGHEIKR